MSAALTDRLIAELQGRSIQPSEIMALDVENIKAGEVLVKHVHDSIWDDAIRDTRGSTKVNKYVYTINENGNIWTGITSQGLAPVPERDHTEFGLYEFNPDAADGYYSTLVSRVSSQDGEIHSIPFNFKLADADIKVMASAAIRKYRLEAAQKALETSALRMIKERVKKGKSFRIITEEM